MDIRFKGASMQYYERTLHTAVTQEDTAEMIVPDALPDVSELLLTDGNSLIRGKDVRRSGISVTGLSELTVLYRGEDGSLGRLPVDIPFETEISFNVPDDGAKVVASLRLISAEGRILNSRKLLLRSEVCITVSVWTPVTLRWASEAACEDCSVELKTERSVLRPVSAVEEKTFTAEETQALPAGRPRAEGLLYARAALQQEEAEPVGRRLVARGTALVCAVYRTAGEGAAAAEFRLPWSAFLELPEGEEELSWDTVATLTGCSVEVTEEGSFAITVGGVVQAAIRSRREISAIADAYGTDCVFTPRIEAAEMDAEAASETKTETVSFRLEDLRKARSLVCLAADCGRPRQEKESLRLPVSAKALCVMEDGSLGLLSGKGEALCPGSGVPEIELGEVFAAVSGGGVEVRLPVSFRLTKYRRCRLSFLTDGEASPGPAESGGPNVVLLRASEGDSVWSLGKKKGVSCAAVRSYNQLGEGEEPAPGTLLLLAR